MELKDLFFLLRKIFARGTIIARAAYYCSSFRRRELVMWYIYEASEYRAQAILWLR